MAKVLCISSQVVWGPVGNSAAVPPLQAMGHEVLQVPTILLSHHPGHGRPAALRMEPTFLTELLQSVEARGGFRDVAAVMTGYFASAEQVKAAAEAIARLKAVHPSLVVLVDPVIGDDGKLYVPEPVAFAIADLLAPLATILTPNAFELHWLTAMPVEDKDQAARAAYGLNRREVLVKSVPVDGRRLVTLLVEGERVSQDFADIRAHVPHGVGDFLAGAYLGQRLTLSPPRAFEAAMARLREVITRSGDDGVLPAV